jgi:acyl transferase domain-containing protein/NAD(P)-dependent dehydrogenase (short-subunit alcohol dehydrogenase family)
MFPQAPDLARYWANIRSGVDAIVDVPESHWKISDYFDANPKAPDRTYAHRGGFLTPVPFPLLDFGIAPNSVEATDTTQLLGLLVARAALADAGLLNNPALNRDQVSVILGVTGTLELVIPLGARLGHPIWRSALAAAGVDHATAEDVVKRIADSYVGWQENSFPGLLGNVAAGRIANRLDLRGANCVVDAACASSLGAVNLAILELAAGRCDVAVTGGLDTFNDIFMYMCFSKTTALSPSGDARPFDADADGTILGEGLGVLVLKRLDDARRDGDRIYAVIRSVGASSDGLGQAVYAPSAAGQARALEQAYQSAGISPATVGLVEAHGTGTKVGDATELSALEQVYRSARPEGTWCALGSVKSQVGHTKSAAGAAGLIKAALALYHKVLPPTSKVRRPVESLAGGKSPFYLTDRERPWLCPSGEPRRAAVSAFGFGGSNFHCVLEEEGTAKPAPPWDGDVQILAYSSDERSEIAASLTSLESAREWDRVRALAAAARKQFSTGHRYRVLIVAERTNFDGAALAAEVLAKLDTLEPAAKISLANGAPARSRKRGPVFAGMGKPPGALAMLFPGQGSQYVGMLRGLACQFPPMHRALDLADSSQGDKPGSVLLTDLIYPWTAFDEDARREQDRRLRSTEAAQPAIGAVSAGLLHLLADFGVKPEMAGGHSFGELTALHAAGRLDEQALAVAARKRSELMAACAARDGAGGMLAVFASPEQVGALIAEHSLDLVIANKNAPRQCVVSGPKTEIERSEPLFAARGLTTRAVPVSGAFHSRAVADAEEHFKAMLEAIPLAAGTIPVYANATGLPYPDDDAAARALLAGQLARPVEFVAQVESMYAAGARTFLEVGPGAKLAGLVSSILEGREHHALAVDASQGAGDNMVDLAHALARVASLGYAVDLTRWDDVSPAPSALSERPGLTVMISGANHRTKPAATNRPVAHVTTPRSADNTRDAHDAAPPASRFFTNRTSNLPNDPREPRPEPRETSRNMSLPPENGSPHANGHGHAPAHHQPVAPGAIEESASLRAHAAPAQRPAALQSDVMSVALKNVQDNLMAIERLATQTADLHRQFLEGQERTQQTFLKLLEHEHRLSFAALGAPPMAAPVAPFVAPIVHVAPAALPANVDAPRYSETNHHHANGHAPTAKTPHQPSPPPPRETVAAMPAAAAARPDAAGILIDVVSEKTGYPATVLDLDMQLDADLGIDSIKRVEILSALNDRLPELPAIEPEQVGSFRTLRAIVDFIAASDAFDAAPQGSPAQVATSHTLGQSDDGAVARVLVEVVADKTGYPAEMLDLDMRLDTDLGIDSIKRVEIFSSIQERLPECPPAGPEQIGSLTTLREIVTFLAGSSPSPANLHAVTDLRPVAQANGDPLEKILLESVADKTGYPVDMLELDMRLDTDLGIDSIKRVEILSSVQDRLPHLGAISAEQLGAIETLRQIVEALSTSRTPSAKVLAAPSSNGHHSEDVPHAPERAASRNGNMNGNSHGNGNGHEHKSSDAHPAILNVLAPRIQLIERPRARPGARPAAGSTVAVASDGSPLADAIGDELARQGYQPLGIDLGTAAPAAINDDLCGLIIVAPSAPHDDSFVTRAFQLLRAAGPALEKSAARGTAGLLTITQLDGTFGLFGLAAGPDPTTGALAGMAKTAGQEWKGVVCKAVDLAADVVSAHDAAERIVGELFEPGPSEVGFCPDGRAVVCLEPISYRDRLQQEPASLERNDVVVISGGARGVTAEVAVALASAFGPRLVILGRTPMADKEPEWLREIHDEPQLKRALLERHHGQRTIQEIGQEVAMILAQREVRRQLARIEAAGSPVEYHSVDVRDPRAVRAAIERTVARYGPIRGLIHGAGVLADRRIVDQTDSQFSLVFDTKVKGLQNLYQSIEPNELRFLVLFSSSTARFGRSGQVAYAAANEALNKWAQQISVRVPTCRVLSYNWGPWGGGMVTDQLKPLFEKEGLGLIPLLAGARQVVDDLGRQSGPVEVVVLAESPTKSAVLSAEPEARVAPRPATDESALETVFSRNVDVAALPVLAAHVIDGHAVLPIVLIQEWLAEAAAHRNPGLAVAGIDQLQLHKGVIVGKSRETAVEVRVGKAIRDGARYIAPVELGGTLANGRAVAHARGQVILADRHEPAPLPRIVALNSSHGLTLDEIYQNILFHGPALQGIERLDGLSERSILAWVATSPAPAEWLEHPIRSAWLTDPLAIDCAFQLVVLWSRQYRGANSLPTAIGGYRQYKKAFPKEGVRVAVEIRHSSDTRAVADIEFLDGSGVLVARIDGYECVIDPSLNQSFRRNRLAASLSMSRAE